MLCPASAPSKLSALKKTIGNNWVHLICAIWIPEVKFGDTCLMNPVECIGHIDPNKWQMVSWYFYLMGRKSVQYAILLKE